MNIDFSNLKIFTVLASTFYIIGLCAQFFSAQIILSAVIICVIAILLFVFNLGCKKSIILFLIFITGIIRAHFTSNIANFIDEINYKDSIIQGRIVSSKNIDTKNNRVKFYIQAYSVRVYNKDFDNVNVKILVSALNKDNLASKIQIGQIIKLDGKLTTPNYASNPYQFDYKKYLLNNDCRYVLYSNNGSYEKIKDPKFSYKNLGESWYYVLNKFEMTRNKILLEHSKNIKSPKLEILGGLVFGNETVNPDEKIKEDFRYSGLLHLLAASGLNVALIFGIWWFIASAVKIPYNLSIITGGVFVVLYTFMTGFPPSILRASLMLLFVLFGKMIDRNAESASLLFFIAFIILIVNPKMIFDVGFQLSFIVTLGLVSNVEIIVSKFRNLDKKYKDKFKNLSGVKKYFTFLFLPSNIASAIAVPLVAQIWVIPIQVHYFNNICPFSVFANLAVIPFIGIISFIGFISSIAALIPVLNSYAVSFFDFLVNPLLGLLIKISAFFASFKISLVKVPEFNVFQMLVFWFAIYIFFINLKNNFKYKKINIVFVSLLVIFMISFKQFDYPNSLEVAMFDVGNADSFLIKTPENKFFLIDAGKITKNQISSGEVIINKYLLNKKINKLENIIITHFDSDHCGGVLDVLKQNNPKNVIIQKEEYKSKISTQILDYLKNNKINYSIAKNNNKIYKEKDLKITTFVPNKNEKFVMDDNETSIVTLLSYKNKNILFMADVGVDGYKSIEKYLPQKIDILKIGHHGAKNTINQEIIDMIKPEYVLISSGVNNYNHPHYSIVNLLENNNIKILSSNDYGFIKIKYNPKNNNFDFEHFDSINKKMIPVLFDKNPKVNFDKSNFVINFVNNNS